MGSPTYTRMSSEQHGDVQSQLDTLRADVRQIAHDLSSPIGVLRMVAYYLQTGQLTQEKRDHYFTVITQNIERVEAALARLRAATEPSPTGDATATGPETGKS